ncbi:MAG: septal ring lytic transglycosylase RlpA family protein [Terriglobia bacterium]
MTGACASEGTAQRHSAHTRKVQYGTASWYGGPHEQGRETACGQPFNDHALTAAHRTLPLGTKVKVTNLRNGRSVTVKIKDRGPWVGDRLIDLSRAAAKRLGFVHRGLAPVKVRVLTTRGDRRSCRSPGGTAQEREALLAPGYSKR